LFSDGKIHNVLNILIVKGAQMIREYSQDQMFLLPPSLNDFIDEKHPARMISDLVDQLNLTKLEQRYGSMGQPVFSPRMILKVIFMHPSDIFRQVVMLQSTMVTFRRECLLLIFLTM